jgi:coenzyme F420-0:L-glutamate ligase / coenzyme F420-1:gamma-L-glutamate ligase
MTARPSTGGAPGAVSCLPVDGIGEVTAGDDLAALLARAFELDDGDIVVVTSKVVSKAEGRVVPGGREAALHAETERVVASRAGTTIARTRHGLVLAAAGIDASNTPTGTVVLLPLDPDDSARRLREALARDPGRNVAVLVTDTAGRAWREGQTDIAIGAAGIEVLHDYSGQVDPHGNELAVTAPAVADELAAAGDLVKRKLDGRPVAVVRGLETLVLPAGRHGPGAVALVRGEASDMFGLGARDAVLAALRGQDQRGFGAPVPAAALVEMLRDLAPAAEVLTDDAGDAVTVRMQDERRATIDETVVRTAAFACGWRAGEESHGVEQRSNRLRFLPFAT